MSEKSIFTKIMEGEIPGDIQYEDDDCIVLKDISPQAPVHLLIIPRKPLVRIAEMSEADQPLIGKLLWIAKQMAAQFELEEGFRIVINNGPFGGESVPHLHVHLLGKRPLKWPPG